MNIYSLVDAALDTGDCYREAVAEMAREGVPFTAADFIARRNRIDDESRPSSYIGRHRAIEA